MNDCNIERLSRTQKKRQHISQTIKRKKIKYLLAKSFVAESFFKK